MSKHIFATPMNENVFSRQS